MKEMGGTLLIIAMIGVGLWFLARGQSSTPEPVAETASHVADEAAAGNVYHSDTYGITFTYPKNYILTEEDKGEGANAYHFIVLSEDTPSYRAMLDGTSDATEGPTAIMIKVYPGAANTQTPEEWIKTTPSSNIAASADKKIIAGKVSGTDAYMYHWTGLYEADNVVLAHKGNIISIISTWSTADEPIRSVFAELFQSFTLLP